MSFIGKWMELENIMLSEISQSQKVRNRMHSLLLNKFLCFKKDEDLL